MAVGCGQKGPLVLPDRHQRSAPSKATAPPTTAVPATTTTPTSTVNPPAQAPAEPAAAPK
jgi:predicted small lipoprotein YifL